MDGVQTGFTDPANPMPNAGRSHVWRFKPESPDDVCEWWPDLSDFGFEPITKPGTDPANVIEEEMIDDIQHVYFEEVGQPGDIDGARQRLREACDACGATDCEFEPM